MFDVQAIRQDFPILGRQVLALPAVKPLNTYPLRMEGSEIQVAVP